MGQADARDVEAILSASSDWSDGVYRAEIGRRVLPEPVLIASASALPRHIQTEIATRLRHQGFAVLEILEGCEGPAGVACLGKAIGLGEPFVPPLYQASPIASLYNSGVNLVTSEEKDVAGHMSFGSRKDLPLHADGILQPIGRVKCSLLYVEAESQLGGRTTLFNSVAAFLSLAARDARLVAPLLWSACLERRATVGTRDSMIGPAFSGSPEELISRFCCSDETVIWTEDFTGSLKKAVSALTELAQPGSSFYTEITLRRRQAILLANDKIAHGRTRFEDSPMTPRRLYRALYTQYPRTAP